MDIKKFEAEFVNFLENAKHLGVNVKIEPYNEVFVCGMGGSGISGKIADKLVENKRISTISFELPKYADKTSLVILVSYSGNTEETYEMYKKAKKQGCQIIGITSGGKIKDILFKEKIPYIKIPYGVQPRMALPYILLPILNILNYEFDVDKLISNIKHKGVKEKAEKLAENLIGKIPLIYSSYKIEPIAYRWKTQFNENVKIHAFNNQFTELDHNELEGYENLNGEYYLILLKDEDDSLKMKKRMDVTKKIIMEKGIEVTEISITGRNKFNRLMLELYIGDLTTIYLANFNETEITEVKLIEELKKKL